MDNKNKKEDCSAIDKRFEELDKEYLELKKEYKPLVDKATSKDKSKDSIDDQ